MGDYKIHYLIEKERQYLDTILTPCGLEVINRDEATHIQVKSMSLIEYIITDHEVFRFKIKRSRYSIENIQE